MAEVTVAEFAQVLKVPVERLIDQLDEAGIKVSGAEDKISEDAKLTPKEAARVLAAIDAALAPAVEAWDTDETPSTEGEET